MADMPTTDGWSAEVSAASEARERSERSGYVEVVVRRDIGPDDVYLVKRSSLPLRRSAETAPTDPPEGVNDTIRAALAAHPTEYAGMALALELHAARAENQSLRSQVEAAARVVAAAAAWLHDETPDDDRDADLVRAVEAYERGSQ